VQGLLETSLDAGKRESDRWIRLKADVPDDLLPVAIAPHRLTQTVLNLVHSARDSIRASRHHKTGQTEAGCIRIQAEPRPGSIALSVIDDAPGPGAEHSSQAGRSGPDGERDDARGLGLDLTYAICERVGGSVEVDSVPGGGTVVTLVLPLACDGTLPAQAGGDEHTGAGG
jgi:signal transduction histidine kinase